MEIKSDLSRKNKDSSGVKLQKKIKRKLDIMISDPKIDFYGGPWMRVLTAE